MNHTLTPMSSVCSYSGLLSCDGQKGWPGFPVLLEHVISASVWEMRYGCGMDPVRVCVRVCMREYEWVRGPGPVFVCALACASMFVCAWPSVCVDACRGVRQALWLSCVPLCTCVFQTGRWSRRLDDAIRHGSDSSPPPPAEHSLLRLQHVPLWERDFPSAEAFVVHTSDCHTVMLRHAMSCYTRRLGGHTYLAVGMQCRHTHTHTHTHPQTFTGLR